MDDIVISVKNLSKIYSVGSKHAVSMREKMNFVFRKKSDETFFALKNVFFELNKGDILGVIGNNGAGKSTLLKLLSQITKPTEGRIEITGRVASLLEVGTGFHPELTGRENIYLNGTILGMTRKEVKEKFNEIVDFSGVEKFIDTPVKHYSSGMYVRLAFAVAAHLEPEILIIDEVLAVGDIEFQKKCIGKMQSVAESGRTILFVSHNLQALQSLCTKGIILEQGALTYSGSINDCIKKYTSKTFAPSTSVDWNGVHSQNDIVKVFNVALEYSYDYLTVESEFNIQFNFQILDVLPVFHCTLSLSNMKDEVIFSVVTQPQETTAGYYKAICSIPSNLLNYGQYKVKLFFVENEYTPVYELDNAIHFEVHDKPREINYFGEWKGFIRPKLNFTLTRTD